jgi:hypothetical protein
MSLIERMPASFLSFPMTGSRGAAIAEFLIVALTAQDARPVEGGVQRRAQLMRDQGDELILRPVGALGIVTIKKTGQSGIRLV